MSKTFIGKKLKALRKEKGISQEELSKYVGVTTSMIGLYEIDARNPSFDVLTKLSEYFDVTTDYLLGITDNPKTMTVTKHPDEEIPPELLKLNQDFVAIVEDKLKEGMTPEEIREKIQRALKIIDALDK